jgi:uncharacterized membrane protein YgcG
MNGQPSGNSGDGGRGELGGTGDERVRQLFESLAGPAVDAEEVEAGLRMVRAGAERRGARRFLVPAAAGMAAAAAVAAVVVVRAASDDDDVVRAGRTTVLPAVTTVPGPASTPSVPAEPTTAPVTTPIRSPAPTTPAPPVTVAPGPSGPLPTAAPPAAQTSTFSCAGGSVTVRWSASALELLGVSPAAGFSVEDQEARPDRIDVRFASSSGGGGGGHSGEHGGGEDSDSGSGGDGDSGGGEAQADEGQRSELRLRLRDGQPVLDCRE